MERPSSLPASNSALTNSLFRIIAEGAPLDIVIAATRLMGDCARFNHWFYDVGKKLGDEEMMDAGGAYDDATEGVEAARLAYVSSARRDEEHLRQAIRVATERLNEVMAAHPG
jgi:hypothetical protein